MDKKSERVRYRQGEKIYGKMGAKKKDDEYTFE